MTGNIFDDAEQAAAPLLRAYQSWIFGDGAPVAEPNALLREGRRPFRENSVLDFCIRELYVATFGYPVPTSSFIDAMRPLGPIIEVGAGRGFLSKILRNAGIDAIATDIDPDFLPPHPEYERLPVERLSAVEAVKAYPDRTVLSSWPCCDSEWLTEAALAMAPDQRLAYIGEGPRGCTAGACFFDLVGAELMPDEAIDPDVVAAAIWPFPSIHDGLVILTRTQTSA
jgi:hypothetical protein